MKNFNLAGEHGYVRLDLDHATETEGRYALQIQSWDYAAKGYVWLAAAEVAQFTAQLRQCYEALQGNAELVSQRGNLALQVAFEGRTGDVAIRGVYRATLLEENELRFHIQTDQSFIGQALAALAEA